MTAMEAAVYRGNQHVSVEPIPVPEIGAGEILIRVEPGHPNEHPCVQTTDRRPGPLT